ncbi:type II toxin-antitoxin system TacA family antitoxin [Cellulomonas sp. URHB0016]
MPSKTDRIEVRTDAATGDLIRRGADLAHTSTSQFVVDAARDRAEALVARADVTLMPAAQFDALMASLDHPTPMPVLRRAAERPRRFKA